MATLTELIARVVRIVDDTSYTSAIILEFLNEGMKKIAGGVLLPDGRMTPALPDLVSSGTVTTSLTLPYVTMPVTYQRKPFFISSVKNDDRVVLLDSYIKFLKRYPELDETGSIEYVCVVGRKIYYQPLPSVADTLTIHFHRYPVDMSLSTMTGTPDGLPVHLQMDLLSSYACREIFDEIEQDQGGSKPNMTRYGGKFIEACLQLTNFIGNEDGEPLYFDDAVECY